MKGEVQSALVGCVLKDVAYVSTSVGLFLAYVYVKDVVLKGQLIKIASLPFPRRLSPCAAMDRFLFPEHFTFSVLIPQGGAEFMKARINE